MLKKWLRASLLLWMLCLASVTRAQFNPSPYGTVLEHLTAESLSAHTDNDFIASWPAVTGVTFSTTQGTSNQPQYKASITPTGKPVLRVGTGDQRLFAASNISAGLGSYTIFVYGRTFSTSAGTNNWLFDTASGRFVCYLNDSNNGSGAGFYAGAFVHPSATPSGLHTFCWTFDASTSTGTYYVDNALQGTGSYPGAGLAISGATSLFGAEDAALNASAVQSVNGDVADLTIYSGVLSSANRTGAYNAITAEYVTGATALSAGTITASATTSSSITPQVSVNGGTAPYSVQFAYATTSGGTYTNIGSPVSTSGAAVSSAVTGLAASTTYYFKATVTDSASGATVSPASGGTALATQAQANTFAPTDSRLRFSGRWNITSSAATTINCGSLLEFAFSGSAQATLTFATSGLSSYPDIQTQIDDGPIVRSSLSSSVSTITLTPASTLTAHTARVWAAGIYELSANQWTTQSGAVSIAGVTLDAGATLLTVPATPNTIEFVGDSTLATVRLYYSGGASDQTVMDGARGWAMQVARSLGFRPIIVGFGGQGLTRTGSGSVPPVGTAWPNVYSGAAWNPTVKPTIVVISQGYNDALNAVSTSTFGSAYLSFLQQVRAAYPNAYIACVAMPNINSMAAGYSAAIQSQVTAFADSKCAFIDLSSGVVGAIGGADYADNIAHFNLGGDYKLASAVATALQTQLTTWGVKVQTASGTTATKLEKGSHSTSKGGH